jgi:hypothetical protein
VDQENTDHLAEQLRHFRSGDEVAGAGRKARGPDNIRSSGSARHRAKKSEILSGPACSMIRTIFSASGVIGWEGRLNLGAGSWR